MQKVLILAFKVIPLALPLSKRSFLPSSGGGLPIPDSGKNIHIFGQVLSLVVSSDFERTTEMPPLKKYLCFPMDLSFLQESISF
jgi:hypothetical protein